MKKTMLPIAAPVFRTWSSWQVPRVAGDTGARVREDAKVDPADVPYYRRDLASIHHLCFGFHADDCAPGVLKLLEPVRGGDGLVVELGCGSGLLTRHLLDAGHRVIATDASPAMLDLARAYAPEAEAIHQLVLPEDPIPEADAIVSVGHVLNYLHDLASIQRALISIAGALRPGGLLAIDLCDLDYAEARADLPPAGWVADGWALITERSVPRPDRFVRQMAIFTRNEDGSWRRDDERHDNVLIETELVPHLLAEHGVRAKVEPSFGSEELPEGLRVVVGNKVA
jgi:SAM-dependent methyltransferase